MFSFSGAKQVSHCFYVNPNYLENDHMWGSLGRMIIHIGGGPSGPGAISIKDDIPFLLGTVFKDILAEIQGTYGLSILMESREILYVYFIS